MEAPLLPLFPGKQPPGCCLSHGFACSGRLHKEETHHLGPFASDLLHVQAICVVALVRIPLQGHASISGWPAAVGPLHPSVWTSGRFQRLPPRKAAMNFRACFPRDT